jgi:hypothetical protein
MPGEVEVSVSAVASAKGQTGEILVALEVSSLDNSTYLAFHNVTVEADDGTSQIDHVILSRFGVFVVETKNYTGWIFGEDKQAEWTCILGPHKYTFQNPLRQNYRHIKVLSELLGLEENKFYPIIAFCGDAEFRTPMPANVMTSGYSSYIRGKSATLIPEPEVQRLADRLRQLMLPHGAASFHQASPRPAKTGNKAPAHGQPAQKAAAKQVKPSIIAAIIAVVAMGIAAISFLTHGKKSESETVSQAEPAERNPAPADSSASQVEPADASPVAKAESAFPSKSKAAQKEAAWQRWYRKPGRCEVITDGNRVDCANQYIAARRQFERLYAAGKVN